MPEKVELLEWTRREERRREERSSKQQKGSALSTAVKSEERTRSTAC
jgi:hypothetical protein